MDATVFAIFVLVYLGMILGRLPWLAIDRTGVALLGAIALVALAKIGPREAWLAVDVTTIALLFGLMVVSAQFRLGGFYSAITRRIAAARLRPPMLLLALIGVVGLLSAILSNDVVCFAVCPLLTDGCLRRRLDPIPFLLALACASNVGSAATLIGNPQNMLIGQTLDLSFGRYFFLDALVPTLLGLVATWLVICWRTRGRWEADSRPTTVVAPPFDAWQSAKAIVVTTVLIVLFFVEPAPREAIALAAGGVLLLSRKLHSREMLACVDWQLLVLFVALFVVNDALAASGTLAWLHDHVVAAGVDPSAPGALFWITAVLSNVVSNVPAVMLLLPSATHPLAGAVLALSSTLAGNLLVVGSIANIIVITQADALGVRITWAAHARVGVPVALLTLLIAGAWLALRATMV